MSGKNNIISQIESEQMTKEIPAFAPGDTVVIQVRVPRATVSVCRRSKAL